MNKSQSQSQSQSQLQELLYREEDELDAVWEDDQSAKELSKFLEYHELTSFLKKEHEDLLLKESRIGGNRELVDSFEKNNIDSFDKFINLYFEKDINNETDNLPWLQKRYEAIIQFIELKESILGEIADLQK